MVVAEGRTERAYFDGLRRRGCDVEIKIPSSSPTDALNLVRLADRVVKKGHVDPKDGDLVICAFDVQGNDPRNMVEAIRLAESRGIILAISNPCIEVWLLMHFQDVKHRLECQDALSSLSGHIRGYRKGRDYREVLEPGRGRALARASSINSQNGLRSAGDFTRFNPSTSLGEVVSALERMMVKPG